MKLVQKLTALLVAGTCVILAANGWLRVRREVDALREDRLRDHDLIAHSLVSAAEAIARVDGRERALSVIEAASARSREIRFRWLDAAPRDDRDVTSLATGATLTRIRPDEHGESRRVTYAPVEMGDKRGFIELSESLHAEQQRVASIARDTIATTAALILVSAALSVVLGVWLVGRPVRSLADKARRIGRGDFGGPVKLRSRDELGELASEMNAMCDQLLVAKERVARS
jgi:HAMP domain-containing protein